MKELLKSLQWILTHFYAALIDQLNNLRCSCEWVLLSHSGTYFPSAKHSSLTVELLATGTTSGNCTSIFGSYSPITPAVAERRIEAVSCLKVNCSAQGLVRLQRSKINTEVRPWMCKQGLREKYQCIISWRHHERNKKKKNPHYNLRLFWLFSYITSTRNYKPILVQLEKTQNQAASWRFMALTPFWVLYPHTIHSEVFSVSKNKSWVSALI